MSSVAQIEANRQNARKSTGPKSDEGKAASSENALTHGLTADRDVIPGESQAAFDTYQGEVLEDLAPAGVMESILADRVASLSWRLMRAVTIQNQAFSVLLGSVSEQPSDADRELALGRAVVNDFSNEKVLERILTYERRIELSLYRTTAELRRLRRLRQASGQPLQHFYNLPDKAPVRNEANLTSPAASSVGQAAIELLCKNEPNSAGMGALTPDEQNIYDRIIHADPGIDTDQIRSLVHRAPALTTAFAQRLESIRANSNQLK